uniref:receptor protein-tyrosine kinase n=1 Tax=Branchiostoma floridae TaxID=7739 RepID=C3ZRH2_BRAFL|eukprot:XP_002588761.1 hypothetical protein BRAFLDRAFT_89812 [Branchiostoma floridae]
MSSPNFSDFVLSQLMWNLDGLPSQPLEYRTICLRSAPAISYTWSSHAAVPLLGETSLTSLLPPGRLDFVRIKVSDLLTFDHNLIWPYGYRTDGDILRFYIVIDKDVLDFDLTPETDREKRCAPTHSETQALAQLSVNTEHRSFPDEDWPWVPFYYYQPWDENEYVAVMTYTYLNVKVRAENSRLNKIDCVMHGKTFHTEVIVKACPIGRFGRFCAERCQCYNGASCHSFNGACRCAPGWRGRNCTTVHPEVRISPFSSELDDLRYGQELQLTCTAYNFRVSDITWYINGTAANGSLLNITLYNNSSVLSINSLLPEYQGHVTCVAISAGEEQYTDEVDIRIAGCQDNYYGELCDQVCNCTELETCNRTLGCVCDSGECLDLEDSQTLLLAISLSAAGLILLLLGAIFLLHRHNNRLRVGNIDDPEVFRLEQNLIALVPLAAGSSSGSIDMELLKEREIHRSRLQVGQLLGEGAFGHVVKATLTQPETDDVVVAVKKLKGPLQLVLEYAEHGSLLHLLWTLRAESKLNRTVLVNKRHIFENMMVEVCSGLEHLASRRLVHRDIAARNILICGKGTAKIADFGLARDMYAVGYHRQDGGNDLLPLKWMAPEGLKNEARFTHKSDVWSFGVLLWEVAQLGRTPYPGMEGADRLYDALQNHFRLPRPQLCTEERYQLMLQCWKFNEKTRPDATTVRQQLEADPNINFDSGIGGYISRDPSSCPSGVLTFFDGGSSDSRVVDTFCIVLDDAYEWPLAPYHLSTASTGHQLHVVFTSNLWSWPANEFDLTFTTREIDAQPIFDENTFISQTEEDFTAHTAANFVRIKSSSWVPFDERWIYPFGYRTDRKTPYGGDILEFYLTIQNNYLDFDVTPDTDYVFASTHSETVVFSQLFVNKHDGNFPLEDWPWISFYWYDWDENDAVMKYTYFNVKMGEENSELNEISFVMNGQTFYFQVIVKACPIGRFGRFCAERCQCYNGASCHSFNGACSCTPGWRGRNCNIVNPEVRISPSTRELADLRYGQELQLTCTAYNIDVTDITWSLHGDVSDVVLNVTSSENSSVLHITSLLPEHEGNVTCEGHTDNGEKNDTVEIQIVCEDNYYGEFCDQVCNCTEEETCDTHKGCVCQGEACPAGSSSGSIDMELLKEREIHRSRLQGGQLLGEGAFGHVIKATLTQPDEEDMLVAVKKLKGPLQLVLEYAEHGSLLHLLWTLRAESKLNRTVLVNKRHIFENMMVEVCCGLEHLASRRLVHRDIAARNILICGKGTAKIADFGLARDMYAVGYHRQDGGNDLLPLKWMAPEGLKNEARFTHKSDVWSFGVLLWEVAQLGRTPYPGMEGADRLYDALQNHFRLPRPQLCTEERYQLMLQCWKFNEKTRPDATTVRQQLAADPNPRRTFLQYLPSDLHFSNIVSFFAQKLNQVTLKISSSPAVNKAPPTSAIAEHPSLV